MPTRSLELITFLGQLNRYELDRLAELVEILRRADNGGMGDMWESSAGSVPSDRPSGEINVQITSQDPGTKLYGGQQVYIPVGTLTDKGESLGDWTPTPGGMVLTPASIPAFEITGNINVPTDGTAIVRCFPAEDFDGYYFSYLPDLTNYFQTIIINIIVINIITINNTLTVKNTINNNTFNLFQVTNNSLTVNTLNVTTNTVINTLVITNLSVTINNPDIVFQNNAVNVLVITNNAVTITALTVTNNTTTNSLTVSTSTTTNSLTVSTSTSTNSLTVSTTTSTNELTVSDRTTTNELTVSDRTTTNELTVSDRTTTQDLDVSRRTTTTEIILNPVGVPLATMRAGGLESLQNFAQIFFNSSSWVSSTGQTIVGGSTTVMGPFVIVNVVGGNAFAALTVANNAVFISSLTISESLAVNLAVGNVFNITQNNLTILEVETNVFIFNQFINAPLWQFIGGVWQQVNNVNIPVFQIGVGVINFNIPLFQVIAGDIYFYVTSSDFIVYTTDALGAPTVPTLRIPFKPTDPNPNRLRTPWTIEDALQNPIMVFPTSPTTGNPISVNQPVQFMAAIADGAGVNLRTGVDPTAPNDGDLWITSSTIKARIGGVTKDLLSVNTGTTGSGTQNQLTKWNNAGGTTIGDSNVADDGTSVTVNSSGAANKVLIVKAASAPTANMQEWQDNTGTMKSAISATGLIKTNRASVPVNGNADISSGEVTFWLNFGIQFAWDQAGTVKGFGLQQPVGATGPVGNVVKKIQIFDVSGTSIGYIPIYDSIT